MLAGLGEGKFGAGKRFDVFGYITLSTGVGGAKIVITRTNTNFNELMRTNERPRTNANNNNREPIRTNEGLQEFAVNDNNVRISSHQSLHKFAVEDNKVRISSILSSQKFAVNDNNVRISSHQSSHKFAVNNDDVRSSSPLSSHKFAVNYNLFGSEPGHSFLLMNDFLFEVEELLGGENIRKIFGKKPEEIKDKKFWNYYHKILSIFLINVSIFWSVDKIILGGGITKSLDFKRLNLLVNKLHPLPIKIKIIKAKLNELSVLYGGLVITGNSS